MILTFLFLEMHTDNSTNCTLLGPVDCDSFYKWIPLNRWPGCHLIRGIAFYLLCSLFSVSLSHVHHIVYSPPPPPLPSPSLPSLLLPSPLLPQMAEPVVKCECDGGFYVITNVPRKVEDVEESLN